MTPILVSDRFVGRRPELDRLTAALERARGGTSAAVLVAGEAGVGKSRLLREFTDHAAADGARTLAGSCVELSADGLPLAPLVDILRTLHRTCAPEEFSALLGSGRDSWARLLPELGAAGIPAGAPELAPAQLFELTLALLERVAASRPLVLVLEDLHWADRSTLDLAAFLVRALGDTPVVLVMTYRSDELDRRHPLRQLVSGWERARAVDRIEVGRFGRDEVAEQLAAILRSDAAGGLVDRVYERSGGNAFLVEEVVGVVAAGGDVDALPQSLRDLLLVRTAHLSEPTQQLLHVASAAGGPFSELLLAQVAGVAPDQLYEGLREAVDHHVLVVRERGDGYAFRHELLRDALDDDLLPGERVRLHGAYAAAIEAQPSLAGETAPALLAHHWYAAFDLPRALTASVTAARYASDTVAPAEAARHLERALEIWPAVPDAEERTGLDHPALLAQAAEANLAAGESNRSLQLIDTALAEIPADAASRRADLTARRVRLQGDVSAVREQLAAALASLPAEPSPVLAILQEGLAGAALRSGDYRAAVEFGRAAIETALVTGSDRERADALITVGVSAPYVGRGADGVADIRAGVELALSIGADATALRGYANLSDVYEAMGRHTEAIDAATEGLEAAVRFGKARSFGTFLAGNRAEPLIRLGRWPEAEALAREQLRLDPDGLFRASLLELRAELALLTGRLDEVAALLRELRPLLPDTWDDQYALPYAGLEAGLALASGDVLGAADIIARALADVEYDVAPRYVQPLLWLGMRVEADLADPERDNAANLRATAERLELTTAEHVAYRALLDAEDARRRGIGERDAWQHAAAAWRETEQPYPLAYALWRAGTAVLADGDRAAAGAALREAASIAKRIGATPLTEQLEDLARRARLALGTDAADADDPVASYGLTSREREILERVAAGESNGQIATALFISAKTVSVHVSNILTKFGVSSRGQAAALAHQLGIG